MLNVFLTVDTEIWPFSRVWPEVPLASTRSSLTPEIGFYIYGETDSGSFGVPFQLDCLKEHGLRATYFVESLFASVAGLNPLEEIVSLIQNEGQDVQLHAERGVEGVWCLQVEEDLLVVVRVAVCDGDREERNHGKAAAV